MGTVQVHGPKVQWNGLAICGPEKRGVGEEEWGKPGCLCPKVKDKGHFNRTPNVPDIIENTKCNQIRIISISFAFLLCVELNSERKPKRCMV